tara:strand:+ start:10969 stop:11415 length:447 start_codon:yes stop_codon:yes gene_type:complete
MSIIFKTIIMLNQKIRTFAGGKYGSNDLFILSKGLNSGKPLEKPCPNCFVCQCDTKEEKEKIYWLLYALWQGNKFQATLVGSVIPFIRKKDLINLIETRLQAALENPGKADGVFQKLQSLKQQELNYMKLQECISQLKLVLANRLINN